MQHLFTFLAPQNLNPKTLELFFSLNQRLSIWPFGRHVQANWRYFTNIKWLDYSYNKYIWNKCEFSFQMHFTGAKSSPLDMLLLKHKNSWSRMEVS